MNRRSFLKLLPLIPFGVKAAVAAVKPSAILPVREGPGVWVNEVGDAMGGGALTFDKLAEFQEEMRRGLARKLYVPREKLWGPQPPVHFNCPCEPLGEIRAGRYRSVSARDIRDQILDLADQATFDTYTYTRKT